jgi:capsular exopolysaccharide synthesis family protein
MFDDDRTQPGAVQTPQVSAAGAPRPGAAPRGAVHLYDRLNIVLRYYKAASVVAILIIAVMMHRTYTTIPMYRAQARIYIETEQATQGDLKEQVVSYEDPEPYYQTQYRILQGRDLARRAVKRLHLETVPEFNGRGPTPTKLTQMIDIVKARIFSPFGSPAKPQAPVHPPDENALADAFLSRIQVSPVRSSRLVDVLFTAADPVFAAKAVNVLAEEYVSQNLAFRLQNTEKELQFLTTEVSRQQRVVEDRERQLANYREQQNAMSLEDRQNIIVSSLNQVNDAVTRIRTEKAQKEALWHQVQAAQTIEEKEAITAIGLNTNVQQIKQRKADLEQRRAQLLQRYGEKHPDVQQVEKQLAEVNQQMNVEIQKAIDAIKSDYEQAVAQERALNADLDAKKDEAADLSRKNIDYSVLQREAESDRQVYETLLQREKELRVVSNSRANNVRLLDRAEVPGAPFTPDVRRGWLLALLFGLGGGVATAFAIDYLDDTVKTPDDIRWRLKVHFLGMVPKVRGNARPLLSDAVPAAFGEAFRALRTALVIRTGSNDARIVAMTSAQPLEGKTTTAVNTALALAIGGARVLLIDADMRRPSVHKTLRIENLTGLSEVLSGEARMREAVQKTVHPNLLCVTAGSPPSNPSELLSSERMKALLQQLEAGPFDWVIIDTPPVLAVTDAVILAPMVSAVTFVVGSEMTRWRLAERAIETLQSGNPRSIAAVLNRVDLERNRYYYSRYYGNHYYSYQKDDLPAAS